MASTPKPSVCGYCAAAPRHRDGSAAHLLCPGEPCACSLRNHRPDAAVREHQAVYNGLPVERCEELDPLPPLPFERAR